MRTVTAYFWRAVLLVVSVAAISAAAALVVTTLNIRERTTVVTVTRSGGIITKLTSAPRSAPSATVIIALLAVAVVLFLTVVFFGRISKISIAGVGEIDIQTASELAGQAAAATGGDRDQAKQIFSQVAPQVVVTREVTQSRPRRLAGLRDQLLSSAGDAASADDPVAAVVNSFMAQSVARAKANLDHPDGEPSTQQPGGEPSGQEKATTTGPPG
jgi:hypothetical protein